MDLDYGIKYVWIWVVNGILCCQYSSHCVTFGTTLQKHHIYKRHLNRLANSYSFVGSGYLTLAKILFHYAMFLFTESHCGKNVV